MGVKRCLGTVAMFLVGAFYVHLFILLRKVDIKKPEELFFLGREAPSAVKRTIFSVEAATVGDSAIDYKCGNETLSGNVKDVLHVGTNNSLLNNIAKKSKEEINHELTLAREKIRNETKPYIATLLVSNKTAVGDAVAGTSRCRKTVHLWASYAGELGFQHGQHQIKCPGSVCDVQLTVDMNFDTMQHNEALVLYHWSPWNWDDMHAHRPPGQKWVFYTLESPRHTRKHVVPPAKYYNTTYDYVMSYRYDSEFRADYGQYIDGKPEVAANDTRNWAEGRTEIVAWMASNCRGTSWPRKQFVEDLEKHIPVGTYGRCGKGVCKPGSKACDATLAKYKFYLALENSECTDYITEKFWIQALVRGLVPIVYGPPRSDYEKVAPPGSFIHLEDFATIAELAEFLKRVDADDALYGKFFEWKKKGSLKPYGTGPNIMCQLGDKLVQDQDAVAKGTYKPRKLVDWRIWWAESCNRRGTLPK